MGKTLLKKMLPSKKALLVAAAVSAATVPCTHSAASTGGALAAPRPPTFSHRTESVLLKNPTQKLMPQQAAPELVLPALPSLLVGGDKNPAFGEALEETGERQWFSSAATALNQPVIYDVYKPEWGFSKTLWSSNDSIDALLTKLPPNFAFNFISDRDSDATAKRDTQNLQARMQDRAQELNATEKLSQFVFSSKSLETVSKSSPWISQLLCEWPTFLDTLHATIGPSNGQTVVDIPMLNSFYDWLGWAFTPANALANQSLPVALVDSTTCAPIGNNLNGSIALVFDTGACDAYAMVKRAATANATAVIVASSSNDPQLLQCIADECNDQSFGLPAISVGRQDALNLQKAVRSSADSVRLSFSIAEQCGTTFGVSSSGALVQTWGGSGLGNPSDPTYGNPGDMAAKQYPSFSFHTYAAHNLNYLATVDIANAANAIVTPVFNRTHMRPANGNCYNAEPWGCGPTAVVTVPPPAGKSSSESLANGGLSSSPAYSNVVLDYYLQCNTTADVSCPQWDHVIQLKACCSSTELAEGGHTCNAQSGFELGRWITSFGRANGHWRTDVTPWLPLLRQGVTPEQDSFCNLTLYTVPWAGNQGQIPWLAVLNLRFENTTGTPSTLPQAESSSSKVASRDPQLTPADPMPSTVLTPWQNVSTNEGDGVYTLFKWIAFNQSYETYFQPYTFSAPADGFEKAKLVTVLSGHGNDNHGCGEFCSTTHHFTVAPVSSTLSQQDDPDTKEVDVLLSFEVVKNNSGPDNAATGCAEDAELALGTTPNE